MEPNRLSRVLLDSTAVLGNLQIDGTKLMNKDQFSKLMEDAQKDIKPGRWLLGTIQEEKTYIRRRPATNQESKIITDGDFQELNDHDCCQKCLDLGELLVCDGCEGGFHLHCAGITVIPEGDWFCEACRLDQVLKTQETAEATAPDLGKDDDESTSANAGAEELQEEDLTLESDAEQDDDVDGEKLTDIAEGHSGIKEVSIVRLSDGDSFHIAHYLGSDYLNLIDQHYDIPPIDQPTRMTVILHDHQRKGNAQAHQACEGPFRGCIIADEMGLGKTHQGIGIMEMVRHEPGMSLVVAPSKDLTQWYRAIIDSFKEGDGLRAYVLRNRHMTAAELLSLQVDVVICSYEFVEHGVRKAARRDVQFLKTRKDRFSRLGQPLVRPTCNLISDIYELTGQPWKRMILDESQNISKPEQARHRAVKMIPAKAVVCMTGTPTHNKWHAVWGYICLLKGHPFAEESDFFSTFGGKRRFDDPTIKNTRRLQRFLQPLMICRPRLTLPSLTLVGRVSYQQSFDVDEMDQSLSNAYYKKYRDVLRKKNLDTTELFVGASTKDSKRCLTYATKAQLAALHPLLLLGDISNAEDDEDPEAEENDPGLFLLNDTDDTKGMKSPQKRKAWLKFLEDYVGLADDSIRVQNVIVALLSIRAQEPDCKVVIFSQYLKFLDILAEVLKREGIKAYRYDGTIKSSERTRIEADFAKADPSIPLLITSGAGGTSLNLQCANVVIQTEVWWNHNAELQALCRCDRQHQKKLVTYIRLMARNCEIDHEILHVQAKKRVYNEALMEPLIRCHWQGPVTIELHDLLPVQGFYDDGELGLRMKVERNSKQASSTE